MMKWDDVLALARRANDHYSMTEREQELLWEMAQLVPEGGRIVELGVCNGKTALVMACAAYTRGGTYMGIDNWSLEGSLANVEELMRGLLPLPAASWYWSLWKMDTHDEQWQLDPGEAPNVDFLIIDADHSNPGVGRDCEVWIPQVKPGGLVAFDDVPSGPGWETSCHAAVREEMEKWTGDWEWAASYGKVVVRRRPL